MINRKKIDKYNYVSFDIFDTLIFRNVEKPSTIFSIVEEKYNLLSKVKIVNFKEERIKAEINARNNKKNGNEDVTLEYIYSFMEKIYGEKICKVLKEMEINTEIEFSQGNIEMIDFFNDIKKRKKIIITSDMYLPEEVIRKILKKNKIDGYDHLYLSSSKGKTKSSSNLFRLILKELSIPAKEIIHIGDNKKSDYIRAKQVGINAILYRKKYKFKFKKTDNEILNSIIKNNTTEDEYYYNFGFSSMGPLLLGYCNWLNEQFKNSNIKKVFFLSRDGSIMKQAFDKLYKLETHYIYASRRSLIVPSLWKANDYNDLFSMMNIPKKIKLSHLLERLGLESINIDTLKTYNLEYEDEYNYEELLKNYDFKRYIESNFSRIKEVSRDEYKNLSEYLISNDFNGKLAVVDIGWFGSMQKALTNLFDKNIEGYYLGIHTRKKTQTNKMHGYLFESNKNLDLDNDEYLFNSIVEFIFSTFHGSVKKFEKKGNVKLYEYEYENSDEKKILVNIQNGALDFIDKVKEVHLENRLIKNEIEAIEILKNNCLFPSYYTSKKLGKIRILDNGIDYIGSNKNIIYYLFNIKKLIRDFKKSTWKIGFLKRTFFINFPYYKIIKYLKKGKNN